MTADELKTTTLDPKKRIALRVTIDERRSDTDRIINDLMGKDVERPLQVHHGARGGSRRSWTSSLRWHCRSGSATTRLRGAVAARRRRDGGQAHSRRVPYLHPVLRRRRRSRIHRVPPQGLRRGRDVPDARARRAHRACRGAHRQLGGDAGGRRRRAPGAANQRAPVRERRRQRLQDGGRGRREDRSSAREPVLRRSHGQSGCSTSGATTGRSARTSRTSPPRR